MKRPNVEAIRTNCVEAMGKYVKPGYGSAPVFIQHDAEEVLSWLAYIDHLEAERDQYQKALQGIYPQQTRIDCRAKGFQNCSWCPRFDCCDNTTPHGVIEHLRADLRKARDQETPAQYCNNNDIEHWKRSYFSLQNRFAAECAKVDALQISNAKLNRLYMDTRKRCDFLTNAHNQLAAIVDYINGACWLDCEQFRHVEQMQVEHEAHNEHT